MQIFLCIHKIISIQNRNYKLRMEKVEQSKAYFNENVKKVLEQLTYQVLKAKPEQPVLKLLEQVNFMIEWLSRHKELDSNLRNLQDETKTESLGSCFVDDIIDEQEMERIKARKKAPPRQRNSISAQAFGVFNQPKEFVPVPIYKSEEEKRQIRNIVKKSFLFSSLQPKELETVLDCMQKRTLKTGEYAIRQGEIGNQLYIVFKGSLSCVKKFQTNDHDTFLKNYYPGDTFGELSLLYNVPRQASLLANEQSELWELDREIFNNCVRDAVIKKKAHTKQILQSIKLFAKMENSEIEKLVDSIKIEEHEQGQYICNEGDQGNCLYIIESGSLIAQKEIKGSLKTVFEYKRGMYFGEIALLCKTTRKASIRCCEKSVLLVLGKNQFERLVGVDQSVLKDFTKYQGLQIE